MATIYPLRFGPILRQYIWGGRRLGSELGKPIGDGGRFAESWEVCDHRNDQSVVAAGPLSGKTLGQLVGEMGMELFGRHHPQARFPLLLKFLDCQRPLSVQVHPDDLQAAKLNPPERGKTEAWVVLATEPGSVIYAGLKPGVDRQALKSQMAVGAIESCLHTIEPVVGDCLLIPAGTVHALGAGLLIAEIQQSSDTTFRLFDWNRLGTGGKPRQLHVPQALAVIDFQCGPVTPQAEQPTDRANVRRLVDCDQFRLDRWEIQRPCSIGGDDRFHILTVIDGELIVEGDVSIEPLKKGGTILLPAACGEVQLTPRVAAVLLDSYLP